jgi:hypothetical protein
MRLLKMQITFALAVGLFQFPAFSQTADESNALAAAANSFAYPQSIFVDSPNGHLWITDFSNHRVLRFDVSSLTSVMESQQVSPPASMMLFQNYPNPFNPTTAIRYQVSGVSNQLTAESRVLIAVYDLLGREVAMLVNKAQEPGRYTVPFNAGGLPSGIYLYSLRTAGGYEVRTSSEITDTASVSLRFHHDKIAFVKPDLAAI